MTYSNGICQTTSKQPFRENSTINFVSITLSLTFLVARRALPLVEQYLGMAIVEGLCEPIWIMIHMALSDPVVVTLIREKSILQLILSHFEDERASIKEADTWTMQIFSTL